MGHGDRTRKAAPVSIALAEPSTTIRALAFERANEIHEERQRERARRGRPSASTS